MMKARSTLTLLLLGARYCAGGCTNSSFPVILDGKQIDGLTGAANAADVDECREACCQVAYLRLPALNPSLPPSASLSLSLSITYRTWAVQVVVKTSSGSWPGDSAPPPISRAANRKYLAQRRDRERA